MKKSDQLKEDVKNADFVKRMEKMYPDHVFCAYNSSGISQMSIKGNGAKLFNLLAGMAAESEEFESMIEVLGDEIKTKKYEKPDIEIVAGSANLDDVAKA